MDLGFSLFDVEFYALFDGGGIFKIAFSLFLRYALFVNALGRFMLATKMLHGLSYGPLFQRTWL